MIFTAATTLAALHEFARERGIDITARRIDGRTRVEVGFVGSCRTRAATASTLWDALNAALAMGPGSERR